jgi:hypothetical protein
MEYDCSNAAGIRIDLTAFPYSARRGQFAWTESIVHNGATVATREYFRKIVFAIETL